MGTLSGGEAQRIRLATQVGSKLVGACYVLDEPTIGLHQRDNDRLLATLRDLTSIGNTVLVVEHDEDTIRRADHVLDIGPGPGVHGGLRRRAGHARSHIREGCPTRSPAPTSRAGSRSTRRPNAEALERASSAVVVKNARQNNLRGVDVAFPLGG